MVQEQLVEYMNSQLKAGVSRDALKSALVGAGWMAADVDDTLKKVDSQSKPAAPAAGASSSAAVTGVTAGTAVGGSSASPAFSPSSASSPSSYSFQAPSSASSLGSKPAASPISSSPATSSGSRPLGNPLGVKPIEPKTIKISDLVSSSSSSGTLGAATAGSSYGSSKTDSTLMSISKSAGAGAVPLQHGGGSRITVIVLAVLTVVFAGAAGYLYYENSSLSGKVGSLGTASTDASSQIDSLNSQVQALTASSTAMQDNISNLKNQNQDLVNNLSLLAAPSGSGAQPEEISVTGTLGKQSSVFTLTTAYGVTAVVKNSSDALVKAALTPLLASSSSVMLGGTHAPGSAYITVDTVNGISLSAPSVSDVSSTASTTAAGTSSSTVTGAGTTQTPSQAGSPSGIISR